MGIWFPDLFRDLVQQIFYVGPIFFKAAAKNRADKSHRVNRPLDYEKTIETLAFNLAILLQRILYKISVIFIKT